MPYQEFRIADLIRRPPFSGEFSMSDDAIKSLTEAHRDHHEARVDPPVVWITADGPVVVDGHTRVRVAEICKSTWIECRVVEFAGDDDALRYVRSAQAGRRNLTPQEKIDLAQRMLGNQPTTREELAGAAGVSVRSVIRQRAVERSDDEDLKQRVRTGQTTLRGAERVLRERAQQARAADPAPPAARPAAASPRVQVAGKFEITLAGGEAIEKWRLHGEFFVGDGESQFLLRTVPAAGGEESAPVSYDSVAALKRGAERTLAALQADLTTPKGS